MIRVPYRSLTFWIFVGLFGGMAAGYLFGEPIAGLGDTLSQIFLRLLRMAVMPLIVVSITSGVISVGSQHRLGGLGARTFGYFLASGVLAILTGQILVNIFRPGVGSSIGLVERPEQIPALQRNFGQILIEIIPENPFQAMAEGEVLPIIFFSILLGYFITKLQEGPRDQLAGLFSALFETMLKMTRFVVWVAPLGVFGINARIVATTGFEAFFSLGYYFFIVLLGLTVHSLVTLPLLIRLIVGRSPWRHYSGMPSAMVMAFSTGSSIVTLPLTMQATTEHSGVSKKVASFLLPIGATVNMNGTALYECVAVVFIAQVYGFELSLTQQLVIAATTLLASAGAASVPMSGLVMMSIILGAVGLPLEGVAIILAVDRILDMFRTVVNVLSDSVGAVIVAHWEGEMVLR